MTGGIGSGKSEAEKIFNELSVAVIDLDDIAQQTTKKNCPGYIEIKKYFGNKYFDKKQEIIRHNLKVDIFKDSKLKKKIESILHPIIFSECKKQIYKYKSQEYIVIVIPLLFETKSYQKLIDESLFIDCNEEIQFQRVSSRDRIEGSLIKSIINSQLPRSEKIIKADKIIKNNHSKTSLKNKICSYHKELKLRLMENKK